MIESILKNVFPLHYGKNPQDINVPIYRISVPFSETDAQSCKKMCKSIEVLIRESVTAVNILTYPERVCLFAWRDYDIPATPVLASRGDARANMQVFGSIVSNMTAQTTSHHNIMGHGFTFMQVKYPSEYKW